ncbi:MAG: leucine-rich repeat domain-containing protein, partial [Pseudomonadota bacterium]
MSDDQSKREEWETNEVAANAEAEARVERLLETRVDYLNLSDLRAMTRLPDRLADCDFLRTLDLVGTQVADISPLERATALQSLNLYSTPVADISPLKGATALQSLNLERTQVGYISPIKGATALQSLNLSNTKVADISPLKGATALQSLDLVNAPVTNITPLMDARNLTHLDLDGAKVTDISPLLENPAFMAEEPMAFCVANAPLVKDNEAWADLRNTQVTQANARRAVEILRQLQAEAAEDEIPQMQAEAAQLAPTEARVGQDGRATYVQAPAASNRPYQDDEALRRAIRAQVENVSAAIEAVEPLDTNSSNYIFLPRLRAYLRTLEVEEPDMIAIEPRYAMLEGSIDDEFLSDSMDKGTLSALTRVKTGHVAVVSAVNKEDAPEIDDKIANPDAITDEAFLDAADTAAKALTADRAALAIDGTFLEELEVQREIYIKEREERFGETEAQKRLREEKRDRSKKR